MALKAPRTLKDPSSEGFPLYEDLDAGDPGERIGVEQRGPVDERLHQRPGGLYVPKGHHQ
jgi:hypothetical protein